MARRNRKPKLPNFPVRAEIESLSHDGRGVAHIEGKTVFIDGALPGEEISFFYTGRSRKHDTGKVCEIFTASEHRVEPKCAHAAICGGCSLQHMAPEQQIAYKQQTLLDNLQRIGQVTPETVLAPLSGPYWGYRHKARLGVKHVRKKGRVLVGFREKGGRYLADLTRCEVLHESVGPRLQELGKLIQGMEALERIAQIEVAIGDCVTVLILRNLDPLSVADTDILRDYAQQTGLHIHLQPKGPDSVHPLYPEQTELAYRIPDFDLKMVFEATDFTQVNPDINLKMINQALTLLELNATDNVLDLFCGLGNFTLPIAKQADGVTGVEGDTALVQRAWDNARRNAIENAWFAVTDLSEDPAQQQWMQNSYNKILIDPPRSGAAEMMPHIAALNPERIVYVSCHPGTLARDAGMLVNDHGYKLVSAGVMDMFPHTTHVESMALLMR